MKIFHNEEIYIKTDNFSDSIFKENTMFFDIETTGFSPVKAIVYMIGCARRIKNRIVIDQYFAEVPDDEADIIAAFASELKSCDTLISFNGVGFDIPFLRSKYKKYKQNDPFSSVKLIANLIIKATKVTIPAPLPKYPINSAILSSFASNGV